MAKIKVNPVGIASLRKKTDAMKKKADGCVRSVSYVRRNLDMEIAASGHIDSRLRSLQKRMQAQEDRLARYARYLDEVNNQFTAADRRVAKQAKNVHYLMDEIIRRPFASAGGPGLRISAEWIEAVRAAGLFGMTVPREVIIGGKLTEGENGVCYIGKAPATPPARKKPNKWDKFKESVTSGWQKAKDRAEEAWEDTKRGAKDLWKGATSFASDFADEFAEDLNRDWAFIKRAANSKTARFVRESTADIVRLGKNIFTIPKNPLDILSQGYKLIDGVIDTGQDLSAVVIQGIGEAAGFFGFDGFEQRAGEAAEELSKREGIGGELGAAGWKGGEKACDYIEYGVGAYDALSKTFRSFNKLDKLWRARFYDGEPAQEFWMVKNLLEIFGFKTDNKAETYAKNANYAYQLYQGLRNGDLKGTIRKNSMGFSALDDLINFTGKILNTPGSAK